jgi:hypothetical protein
MTGPSEHSLLRRAAERAAADPFYLAGPLLTYARVERLDDAGLAAALGCALVDLPALMLCRRPVGEGAVFRRDVEAISQRFGLQAAQLVRLLRTADVVVSLEQARVQPRSGLLAAARDRATDTSDEPSGDEHASDRQAGVEPAPEDRP